MRSGEIGGNGETEEQTSAARSSVQMLVSFDKDRNSFFKGLTDVTQPRSNCRYLVIVKSPFVEYAYSVGSQNALQRVA